MRGSANTGGCRAACLELVEWSTLMLGRRQRVSLQFAALALIFFLLASCTTPKDVQHHVIISVKEQQLALLDREKLVAIYPVSTSKYGLGDWPSSRCTSLGELETAKRIGDNAPLSTVFKDRRSTGETVLPYASGSDPILPRTLWLRGG